MKKTLWCAASVLLMGLGMPSAVAQETQEPLTKAKQVLEKKKYYTKKPIKKKRKVLIEKDLEKQRQEILK